MDGRDRKETGFWSSTFSAFLLPLPAWSISPSRCCLFPALVSPSPFHLSPTDLVCLCLTHLPQGHPVLGDCQSSSFQMALSSRVAGFSCLLPFWDSVRFHEVELMTTWWFLQFSFLWSTHSSHLGDTEGKSLGMRGTRMKGLFAQIWKSHQVWYI